MNFSEKSRYRPGIVNFLFDKIDQGLHSFDG